MSLYMLKWKKLLGLLDKGKIKRKKCVEDLENE